MNVVIWRKIWKKFLSSFAEYFIKQKHLISEECNSSTLPSWSKKCSRISYMDREFFLLNSIFPLCKNQYLKSCSRRIKTWIFLTDYMIFLVTPLANVVLGETKSSPWKFPWASVVCVQNCTSLTAVWIKKLTYNEMK